MNLEHVLARRFAPIDHDYTARDSLLYALSLGMGSDPLDPDELPYVYEGLSRGPQPVVPSQCVILGWQPLWHADPATGIAWKQIVHGEERFRLHRPLPAAGRVRAHHRIVGVQDKSERGALLQVDTELIDRDNGATLATLESLQFLRGDGGCGDWGKVAPPLSPLERDAVPHAVIDYPTSRQAALLYRAVSQDWMAIHADPAVAREAGFERPISHGLNNLGVACRAILKTFARGRPQALRSLGARFVSPGLPGDTLRVELFRAPAAVRFRVHALERGVCLVDRGTCELAD